ncbi:MAG: antitoxin component YwqK of YwqJK toxin-antitoxin module [Patescibacteria group bacterium]|jgi:antitoxin component YwqK of YwqJK toxin-antitoxin module
MNLMKSNLILFFVLGILFASGCKSSTELVETVDAENGEKISYTRRVDNLGKQGLYTHLRKDGSKLEEAMYENDTLNGFRKLYYEDGTVFIEEKYDMGAFQGAWKTFHENGQLKLEGEYIDNKMEGLWKGYYDNGGLKEEVHFKGNEENGAFIEYYKNGKLKAEGAYLGGDNENGLLKLYDETGELIKKMDCKKGVCRTIWTKEDGEVTPKPLRGRS